MKVAVIGLRRLSISDLEKYLPLDTTEIVSSGLDGIDLFAKEYSLANGIKLTQFPPDYEKYGRAALLIRNITIISHVEMVLAFWDGKSRETKFFIENCMKRGITIKIIRAQ